MKCFFAMNIDVNRVKILYTLRTPFPIAQPRRRLAENNANRLAYRHVLEAGRQFEPTMKKLNYD